MKGLGWKLGSLVLLGSLWWGLGVPAQAAALPSHSARHYDSRVVSQPKAQRWQRPTTTGTHKLGSVGRLKGKLVQLDRVIKTAHGTYFQVSRRGHRTGWLRAQDLKRPQRYVLPYTYTSQLYPLNAPNACEAASLKMALSVKGLATKTSLKTVIQRMPRSKNPHKGFTGNPFTESRPGETRTIYPAALTKYAKTYDSAARNLTGAKKNTLIREIKRGNAIVFAGAWRMQKPRPYHVLALVGYQRGKFLVADPYMRASWPNKVYWTKTRQFMAVYHSRHSRAVVIR